MTKQDFRAFTFYIVTICLSAIGLVFIAPPQASQAVVLMLTVPSLLMWGIYGIITKGERE